MATKLENLRIEELSIVDRGANPFARVVVTKRALPTEKECNMDFEQLVATIQKRDNCPRVEALERTRVQHPEAFAAYQRIVAVPASTICKTAAPNPWVSEFIRIGR